MNQLVLKTFSFWWFLDQFSESLKFEENLDAKIRFPYKKSFNTFHTASQIVFVSWFIMSWNFNFAIYVPSSEWYLPW